MTLHDLFNALAHGELANHQYTKNGMISSAHYEALRTHVQLGLRNIMTQFPIIEKQLKLRMIDGITRYLIDPKHADSVTNSEQKWIVDSTQNPFVYDILGYETAYNHTGEEIDFNDSASPEGVMLPQYNIIQISDPVPNEFVYLMYRADHPTLPVITDPNTITLILPDSIQEALQCYVAARVYSGLRNETSNAASGFYYSKFKQLMQELEQKNTLNSGYNETNLKLITRGFA